MGSRGREFADLALRPPLSEFGLRARPMSASRGGLGPPARADWSRGRRGRAGRGRQQAAASARREWEWRVRPPPPPPFSAAFSRSLFSSPLPRSLPASPAPAALWRGSALHTLGAPQCSWDGAAGCRWRPESARSRGE